jgi:hypothetical protein
MTGSGRPAVITDGHSQVRRRHPQAFHYDVIFVDANSGKAIEATAGS